jgi:phospholipase/carboxylesterase
MVRSSTALADTPPDPTAEPDRGDGQRGRAVRRRLAILALALTVAAVAIGGGITLLRQRGEPSLSSIVFGGSGPPTLVLLHGYGSSPERWVPFTRTIQLPPGGRFVFPRAPESTIPPDGPVDGRGWWRLALSSYIAPGEKAPDLSGARPPGMAEAASRVEQLVQQIGSDPGGPVILGGFSQGAMVASQVAFQSDVPLTALILLSGTPVDVESWRRNFVKRRGLPVFIAHGRSDDVLPFEAADSFRRELAAAGLAVTWHPFSDGHAIPAEVVVALNDFLAHLGLPIAARR